VGLVLIGSAHGASMPLAGFALTVAAAALWGCGNIVTRAVGRYGPMNQFAFIVWSSVVAPLPFVALALVMDGPGAVLAAVQHLSLTSMAAVAYIAWISTLLGFGLWTSLMSRYPVNRVAPFTLLVPVVGLTTGWVVFGEQLLPVHFAGAGLLMAGLVVNVFGGPAWAAVMGRLRGAQ
jgi:O-acetylserine/cysteine efflux transporter